MIAIFNLSRPEMNGSCSLHGLGEEHFMFHPWNPQAHALHTPVTVAVETSLTWILIRG